MKFKDPYGKIVKIQNGYSIAFEDSQGGVYYYTFDQVSIVEDKKSSSNDTMDIVRGYIDDLRFLSKLKEENKND